MRVSLQSMWGWICLSDHSLESGSGNEDLNSVSFPPTFIVVSFNEVLYSFHCFPIASPWPTASLGTVQELDCYNL